MLSISFLLASLVSDRGATGATDFGSSDLPNAHRPRLENGDVRSYFGTRYKAQKIPQNPVPTGDQEKNDIQN